jgi:hypothetical protein
MYSHATNDEKIETMSKTNLSHVSDTASRLCGWHHSRDNGHDERIFDAGSFEEILLPRQLRHHQTFV